MKSLVASFIVAALLAFAAIAGTAPPEYRIGTEPGTGVMQAGNPLQGFALAWVGDSLRVTPLTPARGWEFSLTLSRIGWGGNLAVQGLDTC